jgi:hypothetical protein
MNIAHIHGHNAITGNNPINQNTNTPDINLERDIIGPEIEEEIALGMELAELSEKKFQINVATIIMSALLFLIVLAWFDFIQTVFYNYMYPPSVDDAIPSSVKLWYAIMATILIIMMVILLYYYTS